MYYLYILKSTKQNKLYSGYTKDLRRRFEEHNNGKSEYTSHFRPWKLVYYEAYLSEKDARTRERQLKNHANGWLQLKQRITNSINEN